MKPTLEQICVALIVVPALGLTFFRNDWTSIAALMSVLVYSFFYTRANQKPEKDDLDVEQALEMHKAEIDLLKSKFKHIEELAETTEKEISKHNLNQGFRSLR